MKNRLALVMDANDALAVSTKLVRRLDAAIERYPELDELKDARHAAASARVALSNANHHLNRLSCIQSS